MSGTSIHKRLVSLTAPASLEAEQYQSLQLEMQRLRSERDVRMVAFTSPTSGDGKTLTAINLAATLAAGSASRVLLIEADLRRPSIAAQLGITDNHRGLADLVLDTKAALQDGVYPLDFGFSVIPAASPAVPVHEILKSSRLRELLSEARERYDYVVLDTPPLVPVADCRLLAQWLDGLFLVVAANKTPRKLLEEALNVLDSKSVLGIVFNRDNRPFFGYRRRYYQGYFSAA
jgi:receptor protein-tyrosine kinase/non-specific protein-tyrosine kinase